MTITSTTSRTTISGDDTTGPFTTNIVVQAATDIKVVHVNSSGTATDFVKDTDYTVSSDFSTITTTSAVASGESLVITRDHTFTQATDYINTGTFDVNTLETALDKLTMLAQQVKERLGRVLSLAVTSTLSNITLPEPSAGKFIKWNSAGTGLDNGTVTGGGGLTNVVDDTSPQLGGDLDMNGYDIVTTSNADIELSPNGTGVVYLKGNTSRAGTLKLGEDADNGTNTVSLIAPASVSSNVTFTLPSADGSAGQALITDGSGTLSFNSAGSRVLLDTQTASSSSEITFTSGIDSTYDLYQIEVVDYIAATDGTSILLTTSTDGGSSYDSGAGNYRYGEESTGTDGNSASNGSDSATGITIFTDAYANSSHPTNFIVDIYKPSDASSRTVIGWKGHAEGDNGSTNRGFVFKGVGCRLATADVDAVRFASSSGNITSGTFKLYGITTA